MIERDAKPIGNRNPYKPVDVSGRKPPEPAKPEEKSALHADPKGAALDDTIWWRDPLGNWHLHEDQ